MKTKSLIIIGAIILTGGVALYVYKKHKSLQKASDISISNMYTIANNNELDIFKNMSLDAVKHSFKKATQGDVDRLIYLFSKGADEWSKSEWQEFISMWKKITGADLSSLYSKYL